MKILKLALCGAAASLAMAGAAAAQVSVNAGATTEYVFRGLSQGDEAAAFGGADWASDSFYAGVWASSVGFGPSAEVDLYGGWTGGALGLDLDVGVVYYGYLNDPNTYVNYATGLADASIDADYWEFIASGSVPLGGASIGAAVAYSPDFFAEAGDSMYYELNAAFPWEQVEFSGAIGIQTIDDVMAGGFSDEYTTWNLGMTLPVNDRFSVDVRYTDTDADANAFANANLAGVAFEGITATLTATFP